MIVTLEMQIKIFLGASFKIFYYIEGPFFRRSNIDKHNFFRYVKINFLKIFLLIRIK